MNTISLGKIGKIIIPKEQKDIIDILHQQVGSVEWSALLFYTLSKGNIKNPKNLEFTVDFIYPMDVGNSAFTSHSYDSELMEVFDLKKGLEESEMGHIHTHHNMGTFFSGTDTDELKDNYKHYNYYLSLIVNFAESYCAKVAIHSPGYKSKYTIKDTFGKSVSINTEKNEDIMLVGDLDIEIERTAVDIPWLAERITKLKSKPTPATSFMKTYHDRSLGTGFTRKAPKQKTIFSSLEEDDSDLEWMAAYKESLGHSNVGNMGTSYTAFDVDDYLTKLVYCDSETQFSDIEKAVGVMDHALSKPENSIEEYSRLLDNIYDEIYFELYGKNLSDYYAMRIIDRLVELSKESESATLDCLFNVFTAYVTD